MGTIRCVVFCPTYPTCRVMLFANCCWIVKFHWFATAGRTFGSQRRIRAPSNGLDEGARGVSPWLRAGVGRDSDVELASVSCAKGGLIVRRRVVPGPSK